MKTDFILLGAVLTLALFGLKFQTYALEFVPSLAPYLLGAVAAAVAAVACAGGRAGRMLAGRGGWIAWGVAAALMAALLVFGRSYRGGLYLPGRLNPSEVVKCCMVAFAASRFCGDRVFPSASAFLKFAGAFAVVAGETALAGDFGLLAQLVLTMAAMLFAASWFWGVAAFAAVGGGFACVACTSLGAVGHLGTRFAVWRDPFVSTDGAGWQTLHGLAAVVNGGMTGLGGEFAEIRKVPIVESDFAYAGVAELWGLLGCLLVLALWATVLLRGLAAGWRREAEGNRCEALLAAGLVASLGEQVLLNVAGVLNAFPMTGITLPLVSNGGSSLAVTLVMCGVLLGLARPLPARNARKTRRTPSRPRRKRVPDAPPPPPDAPADEAAGTPTP